MKKLRFYLLLRSNHAHTHKHSCNEHSHIQSHPSLAHAPLTIDYCYCFFFCFFYCYCSRAACHRCSLSPVISFGSARSRRPLSNPFDTAIRWFGTLAGAPRCSACVRGSASAPAPATDEPARTPARRRPAPGSGAGSSGSARGTVGGERNREKNKYGLWD